MCLLSGLETLIAKVTTQGKRDQLMTDFVMQIRDLWALSAPLVEQLFILKH